MTKITISDPVLDAGCSAYTAAIYRGNGTTAEFREAIRAAFEAMVEAWPGMHSLEHGVHSEMWLTGVVILPLPTEASDE